MARDAEAIHTLRAMLEDRNLRFPARPRLLPDIDVFPMPDGLGIQFRGAQAPVILRGAHAEATLAFLLPALDGTRTLDDLVGRCPPEVAQVTLLKTLALLHTKGLLSPAGSAVDEKPQPGDAATTPVLGPEAWRDPQCDFGRRSSATAVQLSSGDPRLGGIRRRAVRYSRPFRLH